MTDLIAVSLVIAAVGAFIYTTRFKGKGMPKVGIKRDNPSDYFKDYYNLKLYLTSIFFIFLGIIILIAIFILELL
ncbi:hypothetical protein [Flavobacterium sp. ACN6]|uniref:hypothetical protein n=1 Tax=Flavobacterium sp. ACN6 TaxID=1920426 RepID=UPI000BB33085|nr:hypothetical protein [Flavobacterium sp. ACN6]PBJ15986.1 hypothetical protein BSF42_03900 [Flavobacterium sp. ACN6]